jgi:hypothetical protein
MTKLDELLTSAEQKKVSEEEARKLLHAYFENLVRTQERNKRLERNRARGIAGRFGEEIE